MFNNNNNNMKKKKKKNSYFHIKKVRKFSISDIKIWDDRGVFLF